MAEKKKQFPTRKVLVIAVGVIVVLAVFFLFINKTQLGQRLKFGYLDKIKSLSFKNPFSTTGLAIGSVENISKTNPLRNFNPFEFKNPFT